MVIHFQYAAITNGTVVRSWRFRRNAFGTHADCFDLEGVFRWMTSWSYYSHHIMKYNIEEYPVSNYEQQHGHQLTLSPPKR